MSKNAVSLEFISYFEEVTDPRQHSKVLYPLSEIFLLVLCAVVCGANDWTSIALYGQKKLSALRRFLPFEHGTPSHDQLGILFARLDTEQFQQCFSQWATSINQSLGGVIAIDGKALRRSYDASNSKSAVHIVSAWACEAELTLAQQQVDEKSNEITAIPKLLALLEIKGAIVTLDAMGCQRSICQQIVEGQADYVIGLKGNQGTLRQDVELFFREHEERQIAEGFIKQTQSVDADHGRLETRTCIVCNDVDWLTKRHQWPGLKAIVEVQATRQIGDKIERSRRYYISSKIDTPENMAKYIREHWHIENKLHWVLDVNFGSDNSRIRSGNAAVNMTTMQQAAMALLKKAPGKKSMPMKRHSAAWDDDYLEAIIRS